MADQNCAHSGCNCKVEQGRGVSKGGNTYCSDHCANARSSASSKCQCGHPRCQ
ncbi:MAG: metallothionein [Deltaproteobacteria bacterium]|nr:MAG: metallothionein [Deltaproteobacteria bacterium]